MLHLFQAVSLMFGFVALAQPVIAKDPREALSTFKDCDACPEIVVIPAGSFMMGSPEGESKRGDREGPQHEVTIMKSFAIGKFELTFNEWDACMAAGGCGGSWKGRPPFIRSAMRNRVGINYRRASYGFRVVRDLDS